MRDFSYPVPPSKSLSLASSARLLCLVSLSIVSCVSEKEYCVLFL